MVTSIGRILMLLTLILVMIGNMGLVSLCRCHHEIFSLSCACTSSPASSVCCEGHATPMNVNSHCLDMGHDEGALYGDSVSTHIAFRHHCHHEKTDYGVMRPTSVHIPLTVPCPYPATIPDFLLPEPPFAKEFVAVVGVLTTAPSPPPEGMLCDGALRPLLI